MAEQPVPISVNFSTGRAAAYPTYASSSRETSVQPRSVDTQQASQEALLGLSRLVTIIEELQNNVQFGKGKTSGASALISSEDLGLYAGASTATTLQSTGDINSHYTTYAPDEPAWQGFSSADLALHGIYDGSNGSGTIEFTVNQGGFRNLSDLVIDVTLPNGGGTESITTQASDPESTVYTLSNGLGFSLSSGFLAGGDTASTSVTLSTTETINPDNPFNGSGNGGPHFENGHIVSTGSFDVNGVAIAVSETDSVNSVLAKINASSAGVSARFDTDSEIIELTQLSLGSAHGIELGNDTSGFLAATKLSDAVQLRGRDHEPDMPVSSIAALEQMRSGSYSVNGQNLALDIDNHSLNQVLATLNGAPANVSASFVDAYQRVSLSVREEPYTLSLNSGSTRLFSSLRIDDGDHELSASDAVSPASRKRSYRAANELERFHDGLVDAAALLRQSASASISSLAEDLYALQEDYSKLHGAAALRSMGIEWRDFDQGLIDYSDTIRGRFSRALQRNDTLEQILMGKNDSDPGLLEQISTTIENFVLQQARKAGYGQIVNLYA